jgi:hypothetical protein
MEVPQIFPTSISLEDAREAIKGSSEFFEKNENDTVVFSYKYCTQRTFPSLENYTGRELYLQQVKRYNSIYLPLFLIFSFRECRGIIFNRETGQVIARRYHKFFNIGGMLSLIFQMVNLIFHRITRNKSREN